MLLELVKREGVQVEESSIGYAAGNALTRLLKSIQETPQKTELLQQANVLVSILEMLPFKVNIWDAQNIYYSLLQAEFPSIGRRHDQVSRSWAEAFLGLGEKLGVSAPSLGSHAELRLAG